MTKKIFNQIINVFMLGITLLAAYQSYTDLNIMWVTSFIVSLAGTFGTMATAYKWKYAGLPNMVQNVSNIFVSGISGVYGDAIMGVYYFITEAFSLKVWTEHSKGNKVEVDKTVDWKRVLVLILTTGLGLGVFSFILGGQMIILDALNNATGAVAQYMQKLQRKRAGWVLWGITNVVGIKIWYDLGNMQMAVMYSVFTLNSIRGYLNWSE